MSSEQRCLFTLSRSKLTQLTVLFNPSTLQQPAFFLRLEGIIFSPPATLLSIKQDSMLLPEAFRLHAPCNMAALRHHIPSYDTIDRIVSHHYLPLSLSLSQTQRNFFGTYTMRHVILHYYHYTLPLYCNSKCNNNDDHFYDDYRTTLLQPKLYHL